MNGVLLLESLYVGVGDKEAFADTDGWQPALPNHPADRLGVKAPPMVKLRRVVEYFIVLHPTLIHPLSLCPSPRYPLHIVGGRICPLLRAIPVDGVDRKATRAMPADHP